MLQGVVPIRSWAYPDKGSERLDTQWESDEGFKSWKSWQYGSADSCAPTLVFLDAGEETAKQLRCWVGPVDVALCVKWLERFQACHSNILKEV